MSTRKTEVQKHTERVQREARQREQATQRRANPPQSPEQMREAFKDLDSIDILDRRLTNPEAGAADPAEDPATRRSGRRQAPLVSALVQHVDP
jgi:hypothetical protein